VGERSLVAVITMAATASTTGPYTIRSGKNVGGEYKRYKFYYYTASTAIDTASANLFEPINTTTFERGSLCAKNLDKGSSQLYIEVYASNQTASVAGPITNMADWVTRSTQYDITSSADAYLTFDCNSRWLGFAVSASKDLAGSTSFQLMLEPKDTYTAPY